MKEVTNTLFPVLIMRTSTVVRKRDASVSSQYALQYRVHHGRFLQEEAGQLQRGNQSQSRKRTFVL